MWGALLPATASGWRKRRFQAETFVPRKRTWRRFRRHAEGRTISGEGRLRCESAPAIFAICSTERRMRFCWQGLSWALFHGLSAKGEKANGRAEEMFLAIEFGKLVMPCEHLSFGDDGVFAGLPCVSLQPPYPVRRSVVGNDEREGGHFYLAQA